MLAVGIFSLRGASFEPLATELPLPAALRGKPVWTVTTLSSGQLAVGFEGGVAIGTPGSDWQLIPSPNGQVVRAVNEAHGRILAVGHGFAAFIQKHRMEAISGGFRELTHIETTPEGWLLSGVDGVYHLNTEGLLEKQLEPPTGQIVHYRLQKVSNQIIVSSTQKGPWVWHDGKLSPAKSHLTFAAELIGGVTENYVLTSRGITDHLNQHALKDGINSSLLQAGIVGLIETDTLLLVPTFNAGLVAINRTDGKTTWAYNGIGEIYHARATQSGLLLGSSRGLFSLADPSRVEIFRLDGKVVLGAETTEADELAIVTSVGTHILQKAAATLSQSTLWPSSAGASLEDGNFIYEAKQFRPQSRFI